MTDERFGLSLWNEMMVLIKLARCPILQEQMNQRFLMTLAVLRVLGEIRSVFIGEIDETKY